MYKSKVNIGGHERTVVVFNYKEENELTASKSVGQKHHIHVYDRSGSMTRNIDELIDNMQETIRYIPDGDLVSIIWFSGAGECKTLVKGAVKSDKLIKLLDSTRYTIGCTCFSEALQQVGEIITDLKSLCPNFIVNIFTDGRPVVPWGEDEEAKRIFKEIAKWQNDVIAINTIGYGYNYNQALMTDIASCSMYGVMVHSKLIEDYYSIFKDNYERVESLVVCGVKVEAASRTEILYFGGKSTKLVYDEMQLTMLDKKKNQFILIGSTDKDFDFKINGDKYNSADILHEIPAATLTPVLYAYAHELYYKGNRKEALDLLGKTLKDKYLVDEQAKAFTFDECGEYIKKLKAAVYSGKARLKEGECPDGYIPADDALCVMDILRILIAGDCYYQYADDYKRIGLKTTDNYDLFKKDEKNHYTPLNEVVFNSDKLNVSFRSKITGTVALNPIRAEKVGLPKVINTWVYRNQAIINDGDLNMKQITILVDELTLSKLKGLGIPGLIIVEQANIEGHTKLVLELDSIPMINRTYLKEIGGTEYILKSTYALATLECWQKVVNGFVKKLRDKNPTYGREYTVEQIEVLGEHGIGRDMTYNGVDRKTAEKNEVDFYEAREMAFDIVGMASNPPSLNEVLKKMKEGKKLTGQASIMADYIIGLQNELNSKAAQISSVAGQFVKKLAGNEMVATATVDLTTDDGFDFAGAMGFFEKKLKAIKLEILGHRIEMSSVKIAKTLTGEWFNGLVDNGKGGYTYTDGNKTLVINTKKVKCYY